MAKHSRTPIALTIAGSDSGGGAGIQADLKTFAAVGVHGTSVITCITAQNPKTVQGVEPCSLKIIRQQLEAVFAELPPSGVKTGMLYSKEIIDVVASFLRSQQQVSLIVDPVMVSTSQRPLLKPDAVQALQRKLFPLASLLTPNLDEAAVLLDRSLHTIEEMRIAARELHERFGCALLMKGGHLKSSSEAADVFYDGKDELLLTAPFIRNVSTHGTGCTYSAAIASHQALGLSLARSVIKSKEYITNSIAGSEPVANHQVLKTVWK